MKIRWKVTMVKAIATAKTKRCITAHKKQGSHAK